MNGRLKLIEQQLIGIDSAAFQNLCDVYLALREQELASISRTGSQFGKQKTVKGTPDTFFRLADGSLRYVEYTTKDAALVAKIKEDIDKCLDESKTGVPANEISKIIICFNSRLDVAEETEITKYATSKDVRIELIGLDWLALEIYSKYLILAKDILGIPLDTGQLLPLQNFIGEYDNKAGKLSTPLNNQFLHRKEELIDIDKHLSANNILILSGFPGVGKTKIALEALNNFLAAHAHYTAFAVSKKDMDIGEDLRIHLQTDKDYVLLVDDANRQLPNFKQILGVFKEKRKGNIKLLITVRSYAFNDVKNECFEFDPHEITIEKFSDQEITDLVKSDSFKILNPKYQKKIVELADGNARLAVMAARLAREQQQIFLLGDISDLYDSYFQTFIKDSDIFTNETLTKALGIVSFFFTINRTDKPFITVLLKDFDIDYYEFNEAIDELHKRELLEVHYNHARVTEQVMATYFFYKVFIKDEMLSFKTLLFNYFSGWKKRFSDTIIPSNNSFGYENVFEKINGTLDEYLYSIYDDEEKAMEFFSLFWFYKREEMLAYFHQRIKNLPEPEDSVYDTAYEMNAFVWDRDKTLDFLIHLFEHHTESFIPSLELAFEYCRKKPEELPELIRRIREKILFDEPDEHSGFIRQIKLFELLIKNFKEGKLHYVSAFFALAQTFLGHHFQITKGGRNNTITFYQYPLPFYEVTQDFRKNIWNALFDSYEKYPQEILAVLKKFKPGFEKPIPEILKFDLSFIMHFIEAKLDPSSFENIYFVRELVRWLNREKIADRSYQKLNEQFINKEYEYFRKLDWNRVRGKQDFDFEKYEDFQKLKEEDIRVSFQFKDQGEFAELHKAIHNTLSLEGNNGFGIYQSLDIIAEETFIRNYELGFKLLESILQNYPPGLSPLYKPMNAIIQTSEHWVKKLWNLLLSWEHEYKIYWQLAFFECLPQAFCNEYFKNELISTLTSIDKHVSYLRFDSIEKFMPIDKDIIDTSLNIVVNKIEDEKLAISLSFHFFEKYSKFIKDLPLIGKAYIQQEKLSDHFDLERKGLQTIIEIDENFLFTYLTEFYTDKDWHNRNTHNHLPFLWDLENHLEIINKAANLIVDHNPYFGIGQYSLSILFSHLTESRQVRAKEFILNYITQYNTNRSKMNAIFDMVRHYFANFFETAFLRYLSLNTDLENFKEIYWRGNGGVYNGDTIIGELHAREWQNIMTTTEKAPDQLNLIPIKAHIKQQIGYELKSAEEERKRKFINPDW